MRKEVTVCLAQLLAPEHSLFGLTDDVDGVLVLLVTRVGSKVQQNVLVRSCNCGVYRPAVRGEKKSENHLQICVTGTQGQDENTRCHKQKREGKGREEGRQIILSYAWHAAKYTEYTAITRHLF